MVEKDIPFCGADGSPSPELGLVLNEFNVSNDMYKENRSKLLELLRQNSSCDSKEGIVLFQGGESPTRYESDFEPVFRQESTFAYLFGVKEPDVYGVIEICSGKTTLFFPLLPGDYAIFMGEVRSAESFKEEYGVDNVLFSTDIKKYLSEIDPSIVYTCRGYNADSGRYSCEAKFPGIEDFRVDNGLLYDLVVECRVIKSQKEVALLQHTNDITCEAHCWVMRHAQPGMKEFQLESMFQHWCYFRGGCRHQSYTSICGCGGHGSVLHYGHAGAPNDGLIKDGDMALLDMGAELKCYTSDVTCTFPVNGVFTADQKFIYEAVLAAQFGVMKAMKPGVSWIDMHTLSYRLIIEKLKAGGLLSGDVDAMMAVNLGSVFMPHGLGHFMGLDTHDVGGRPKGHEVQTLAGYKSLRCCVKLRPGMVITVEPGVYFNDYSLDLALKSPEQSKFINRDVLERFRGFGGVRLEDDVLITETGIRNLTHCPRVVQDVEDVIAGKKTFASEFTTFAD